MAKTVVAGSRTVPGATTSASIDITGDATYATGGYPVTPQDFGLTVLRRIVVARPKNVVSAKWQPVIVATGADGVLTAVSLALVVGSTGSEVANGTDVSTGSWYLIGEGN